MSRWLPIVALIPLAGFSHADAQSIEELMALMEGVFAADDGSFTYRRSRVSAPALGEHVVYLQVNRGKDAALYRQRILILSEDTDSRAIVETAWTLAVPETFENAGPDHPAFATLALEDLGEAMAAGCEQQWHAEGDEWQGRVDPSTCSVISTRTGLPRRIESETRLTATGLRLAERGFDAGGENQLFGTPPGEWLELRRMSGTTDQ